MHDATNPTAIYCTNLSTLIPLTTIEDNTSTKHNAMQCSIRPVQR
jgi:hypothetical protein